MSKPTTTYIPIAKPKTSFTAVTKPSTSYNSGTDSPILMNDPTVRLNSTVEHMSGFTTLTPNQLSTKVPTTYTGISKPDTSYDSTGGSVLSWLLNSTIVTLNSTIYLLSGYTGATPNQLNNKPKTSYAS